MNEIITTLLSLLQTAFGTTFKLYWNGKVPIDKMNEKNCPILVVTGIETKNDHTGTLRDDARFGIAIDIIVNTNQYLNNSSFSSITAAQQALENFVEARDVNGQLLTNTLMHVVHNNLPIGTTVIYTDKEDVKYDDYMPKPSFPYAHVRYSFTAFARPNRT